MSTSPRTLCGACPKVPASIILPPRELKHYRRWQNLYTTRRPSEQMSIPTATEYDDFQQWLRRQDSGYFSDIFEDLSDHIQPLKLTSSTNQSECPFAVICRHTMHPITAGQIRPRCPVCTVDVHLNYVRVLTQALKAAGGRAPSCTLTASEHQVNVYSAWLWAKISALRVLSDLEEMAQKEAEWTSQHPNAILDDVHTASKALELYWFETDGHEATAKPTKKGKTVVFSSDTIYEPGRAQEYYWTRSPRYEPGKYATVCVQTEAIEDIVSEDSEDYSQATDSHFWSTEETELKNTSLNSELPPRPRASTDSFDDVDSDSDWEDIDSEEEEEAELVDENEHGHYVHFEIEKDTSFIVFTDD